jgi:CRP/FNR family transcriptional regulator, cyclic AMP receptor protein
MEKRQADAFLRRVTWLAGTPARFQDQVLSKGNLLRLKRAELLYDVGDNASGLFGVVEGHIEVHTPRAGVDATLSFIGGPGFWLGDIAAMTGRPRLLAMVARTDCQLMRLPRAEIVRLTESDPQVWHYFALLLMRNYGTVMSVVHALKQSDPARRVAAMLAVLIDGGGEGPIEAIASQTDIGALANLGRSKVNASLRALEELRLIRRGYGSIEVIDPKGLRAFVHETGTRKLAKRA